MADKIVFLHKNFPQDKIVEVDAGGAHSVSVSLIKTSSKYTFNNADNTNQDLDLNFDVAHVHANNQGVKNNLILFINRYYDSNYNFLEELKHNDIPYSSTFGTYVFKYDKNKFSIYENDRPKNVYDVITGKYFVFEPITEDDLLIKGGKNKKKNTYKKKTYKKKKTNKRRRPTKRRRWVNSLILFRLLHK